jgi:transposase-like protein
MPQLQLPVFPAGATEIAAEMAVQKQDGRVFYLYGHLPVFQHDEQDLKSFRMFTSQLIANGTVKQKDIVRAFGVPLITVKRSVKLYRERGAEGFFQPKVRKRSGRVLKGEVLKRARALLEEGWSAPEVARELGMLANTLHKAIRAKRLPAAQKKAS